MANNRLAGHIDKFRQLQTYNAKLKDSLECLSRQCDQRKNLSEVQRNENVELKDSLRKKENDLKNSGDVIGRLEDENRLVENERRKTQEKLDALLKRVAELEAENRSLTQQMDPENAADIDIALYNRLLESIKYTDGADDSFDGVLMEEEDRRTANANEEKN